MRQADRMSRRSLLEKAAAGAVVGVGTSLAASRPIVQLTLRKRKSITALNPAELAAWRAGVAEMKRRSAVNAADPTGWAFQANVHGATVPGRFFNSCQHGHWWFLPWHRIYLFYFERILLSAIDATGVARPSDFGLPYWDYTVDPSRPATDAAKRTIPQALRARMYTPGDGGAPEPNPLFESQRTSARNLETNAVPLPASSVSITAAFGRTNFINSSNLFSSGFGGRALTTPAFSSNRAGQFEVTPHGAVHMGVGGKMTSFQTAAQDPIFWTHHCNIDRLWDVWLARPVTENPDPNGAWGQEQFTFHDEMGSTVTQPVHRFLKNVQGNLLDYEYDDGNETPSVPLLAVNEPTAADHGAHDESASGHHHQESAGMNGQEMFSFPPAFNLTAEVSRIEVVVPEAARAPLEATAEAIESPTESTGPKKELLLVMEGIEVDDAANGYYEVYLNLPNGSRPNFESPHYLGNLVPFNLRAHHTHSILAESTPVAKDGVTYSLPLTNAVRVLRSGDSWNQSALNLTFVPQAMEDVTQESQAQLTFRAFRVIGVSAADNKQ